MHLPASYGGEIKWGSTNTKKPTPIVNNPQAQNTGFFLEPPR